MIPTAVKVICPRKTSKCTGISVFSGMTPDRTIGLPMKKETMQNAFVIHWGVSSIFSGCAGTSTGDQR